MENRRMPDSLKCGRLLEGSKGGGRARHEVTSQPQELSERCRIQSRITEEKGKRNNTIPKSRRVSKTNLNTIAQSHFLEKLGPRFDGLHLQKYFGKLARSVITLHFPMTFPHLTSK